MGAVRTENLKPGMVTAADVQDRNGRLLLCAGAQLTGKHINIFLTWGVIEADIVGAEDPCDTVGGGDAVPPEVLAAARERAASLFRHTDPGDPVMGQLLSMNVQRQVRR